MTFASESCLRQPHCLVRSMVFSNFCVSGKEGVRGRKVVVMTFVNESGFATAPSCAVSTSQFKCAPLANTPLRLVKPQNYFIILIVAFYKKVFHTKNKTYISTETYVLFPYILIIIRFLFFLPSCICLQFCRTEYL